MNIGSKCNFFYVTLLGVKNIYCMIRERNTSVYSRLEDTIRASKIIPNEEHLLLRDKNRTILGIGAFASCKQDDPT